MTHIYTIKHLLLAIGLMVLLAACSDSSSTPPEKAAESLDTVSAGEAPVGRLDQSVVPLHYLLELQIDPSQDDFSGITVIEISLTEPRDQIWLHGKGLQMIDSWVVNARDERIETSYEEVLESGVVLLTFERPMEAGLATLYFQYTAPFNTTTQALFKTEREDKAYATTQFQPISAREVFPGFDDPGFKTPFNVVLTTREDDVAVTNTPEVSLETLDDGFVEHTFETSRPLPTYLIAFAVGPYDIADIGPVPPNSIRDWELPLRGIVASGQKERMTYALENTNDLLTALEEYFGTPYPYKKLDLIAVPKSFGGAMENAGAITYDEYLVLMDEQSALNQRRAYAAVHAHEMAHMWFGDLVTPDWWTDIWLNESFATWMMYKIANTAWPEGEFDRQTLKGALGAMSNDSLASAREIREPILRNDKIAGSFDGITYQKGGGVLTMLERYIGEEGFQRGIQLHMKRHAEGSANADEFIASVTEGSGVGEVDAAFKSFIEQPGVPLVSAEVVCEEGKKPQLNVSQSRYAPLGSSIDPAESEWLVPMCVSYDTDGSRQSTCAMLREKIQTIELETDSCPSQLHPNADGAGYYRFALSPSWLEGLIAGASSLSASEALVLADSLDASFRAGEASASSWVAGMGTLLNHPDWDVAEMAMDNLESMSNILSIQEQEIVLPDLRRLLRPRFESLSGASDEGSKLLQERMLRFLIVVAKDPELRAALAEQASSRIGLNGEPDPSAVPEGEMETAFSVGVQDRGEPFFDLLLEQGLASEDPAFRIAAFGALARVEDPELAARLQSAVLAGGLQGMEPLRIMSRQMARNATADLTFQWIKANDEALFELVPEGRRSTIVPSLGSYFCSEAKAQEWENFIVSRADALPGYERDLAQATESIRLCAALKEARGADLLAALQATPFTDSSTE